MRFTRITVGYLGLLAAFIVVLALTSGCVPPWRG